MGLISKTIFFMSAVILCYCAASPPSAAKEPETRSSEISLQRQYNSGRWITCPENNTLIVIGISGRLSKPETEIETARDDAARKIAMYHGIQGSIDSVHDIGSGYLDWFSDSQITLEYDTGYEQYKEALAFDSEKDVLRVDIAVFVRFKYRTEVPLNIYYRSSENDRPDWLQRPPQIDGFLVGVGYAGKHQRLRDAVIKSLEAAAADMIAQQSNRVETTSTDGNGSYTETRQKSEGALEHFLVLELYIDPKTGGVYSLAIARPHLLAEAG